MAKATPLRWKENSTRSWLYFTKDENNRRLVEPTREQANVLMQDGGKAYVPPHLWLTYMWKLGMTLENAKDVDESPVFNNEKFPDGNMARRKNNDLDYTSSVGYVDLKDAIEHAREIQHVAKDFHPTARVDKFFCVMTEAPNEIVTKRDRLPGGRVKLTSKFKSSKHLIFCLLAINKKRSKTLILSENMALEQKFPRDESKGENPWKSVNDDVTMQGLRTVGCRKTEPCWNCGDTEPKKGACEYCLGAGKLDLGRVHAPCAVLYGTGQEWPELLAALKARHILALAYTCLHCIRIPKDPFLLGVRLWDHLSKLNTNFRPRISKHWKKPVGAPDVDEVEKNAEKDWSDPLIESLNQQRECEANGIEYVPSMSPRAAPEGTSVALVKKGGRKEKKFADETVDEEERKSLCKHIAKPQSVRVVNNSDLGRFLQRLINDPTRTSDKYRRTALGSTYRGKSYISMQSNSTYCHNVGAEHHNKVWFKILRPKGQKIFALFQKCHSAKLCDPETTEIFMTALTESECQLCFPEYYGPRDGDKPQVSGNQIKLKSGASAAVIKKQAKPQFNLEYNMHNWGEGKPNEFVEVLDQYAPAFSANKPISTNDMAPATYRHHDIAVKSQTNDNTPNVKKRKLINATTSKMYSQPKLAEIHQLLKDPSAAFAPTPPGVYTFTKTIAPVHRQFAVPMTLRDTGL